MEKSVRERWSPLNKDPCPTHGVCSKEPALWLLDCGKHVGRKQIASVRRKPATAFVCVVCQGGGSSYLRDAVHVLAGVRELGPASFEAHLLPGVYKAFDLWWPEQGLAGEVDGEGHFIDSCYGLPATDQFAWDRHVDALCTQAGLRLVRLHHKDGKHWASTVQRALDSQQAVTYSPSYNM